MKLKRIQIVELANGKKRLMVDGHGPMGVSDMCYERGAYLFNRKLLNRINSPRFYDVSKPFDVVAMVVSAFHFGQQDEQGADVSGQAFRPLKHQMTDIFNKLSETADLTDPLMTVKCEHMDRYRRLFVHLYGKQLEAKGVALDD